MKVLITSGGTKIKIDSVRSITNMSKGTFGAKICAKFLESQEADKVIFLAAKESRHPYNHLTDDSFDITHLDQKLDRREYVTFDDYAKELDKALEEQPDIIILAAAVSDYGVDNYVDGKIRSKDEDMVIRLKKLPKLISTVREKAPHAIICGFKLLVNSTEDELQEACEDSIIKNLLDLVVGNDLRDIKAANHTLNICGTVPFTASGFEHIRYEKKDYDLAKVVKDFCINEYNEYNE